MSTTTNTTEKKTTGSKVLTTVAVVVTVAVVAGFGIWAVRKMAGDSVALTDTVDEVKEAVAGAVESAAQ